MDLEDLVGEHLLTGVEFGTLPEPNHYGDAHSMTFILDGHAYCVIEDPEDSYRSSMREIAEVPVESVTNTFEPVRVLARHRTSGLYGNDVLELIDVVTTKIVLEAGTENSDDYYPSYIASFTPENMACNQPRSDATQPE